MKVRTILTTCAAFALVVPAAQAATRSADPVHPALAVSAATRAAMVRGDALNRRYHLGAYATAGSAAKLSPAELRAMRIRGDALNRKYHLGSYAPTPATSSFASDVANSNAVARYPANRTGDRSDALSRYEANINGGDSGSVTSVSSGGGVLHSPAAGAGLAAGLLLLISLAGFALARSRNQPMRPA